MGLKGLLQSNKATTKVKKVKIEGEDIYIRQMSLSEAALVSSFSDEDGTWYALKTCLLNEDGSQALSDEDKPLIMNASNQLVFKLLKEINGFNIPSDIKGKL